LTATIWHRWKERNKKIFKHQKLHKNQIFKRLYENINVLLQICNWKVGNDANVLSILDNWGVRGLGTDT